MSGRNKLMVAAAVVIAVGAGYTLSAEVAPFLSEGRPLERVEATSGARLAFGFSTYSRELALEQCRVALIDPSMRRLPQDRTDQVLGACEKTALSILERSPTNALAAAVAGYADALKGNGESASSLLRLSQNLSPSLAWLAQFRLRAWYENLLPISGSNQAMTADMRLLGGLQIGRAWLAGWYGSRPEAREVILGEMESLPPEKQRSFLQIVRQVLTTQPVPGART